MTLRNKIGCFELFAHWLIAREIVVNDGRVQECDIHKTSSALSGFVLDTLQMQLT